MILATTVLLASLTVAAAILSVGSAATVGEQDSWWLLPMTCLIAAVVLGLPVFYFLGFHIEFPPPHHGNVAWTAIALAPITTGIALLVTRRLYPDVLAMHTSLVGRVRRLFPFHVAALLVLGFLDLVILSFLFAGNIH